MFIVDQPVIWAQLLLTLCSAHPTYSRLSRQTTNSLIDITPGLVNETYIRLPHGKPWPPEIPVSEASLLYPVPDTAITLNFTHFGPSIPVLRALSIMYGARQQVQSHLASGPKDALNEDRFSYSTQSDSSTSRVCSIVVQAHHSHSLFWSQLDQTLAGLTQFASGASSDHQFHYQALAFSITTSPSSANLGTGLLSCSPTLSQPPTAPSKKRATLSTTPQRLPQPPLLLPLPTNLTIHPSFPVPGTTITLIFIWLGPPIPAETINAALHGAFTEITPHLTAISLTKPIPNNKFTYTEIAPGNKKMETVLQIYGNGSGMVMTWATVNTVLSGLYRFVNGIGTLHGREYYRCLDFEVWDGGGNGVKIGYGNLLEVW
ncbi:hypothetical protein BDR22DRAFT_885447 [Usnea florida]